MARKTKMDKIAEEMKMARHKEIVDQDISSLKRIIEKFQIKLRAMEALKKQLESRRI